MKATPAEVKKYLQALEEVPHRLAKLSKGTDEARLQFRPDPKSWSVNDILAHLRSCANVWPHSIYAMLAENEPVLPDINERKWAKVTRYADLSFAESFQAYSLQRADFLVCIKGYAVGGLGKVGNYLRTQTYCLFPGATHGKT